jgi:hypothetical protein
MGWSGTVWDGLGWSGMVRGKQTCPGTQRPRWTTPDYALRPKKVSGHKKGLSRAKADLSWAEAAFAPGALSKISLLGLISMRNS